MSDHDDRPRDDAGGPEQPADETAARFGEQPGSQDDPGAGPDTSVLTGFSWDDPDASRAGSSVAGADAGTDRTAASAPEPTAQAAAGYPGASDPGPAAYPPAAPYPPAGSSQQPSGAQPPYGTSQPYGASPPAGTQQPFGAQQPYGTQQPYGQGYGTSAGYTSTPQPYAYGPPPLSPEAEKVRSSAVLWTVLNGVAIFLCGNLLSIAGVILAALAIGKTRDDVQGARGFVKWSWILFAIGFAFWLLIIIGYVVFFVVLGTAGMTAGF